MFLRERYSSFSRRRCSLVALLLGALACGDTREVVMLSASEEGMAPAAQPRAVPNTAASAMPPVAATDAMPAAAEPASTPEAMNAAGAGGSGPSMREPESTPASGGSVSAGEPPADTEPPAEQPAQPAEPSGAPPTGANPTQAPAAGSTAPIAEPPAADPPATETPPTRAQPSNNSSLARGDDPTRQSAIDAGPFDVNVVTAGLRDGPAYGTQTLYVPEGVDPPFAAVVIVPGRDEDESSIQPWGPFLASHGIVALSFGTNDPGDDPDVRALALLDALETIRAENTRAGGPLEGKLALDHLGVMGWSAGGAAVLDVASNTPSLKAAIALAPFSPGGQYPEEQVPLLIIAGSADPRAGGQSQGVFEGIQEATPKMLFEVQDGEHEVGNDPQNASGEVGLYGLSWLEVFLVGDQRYRPLLEATPLAASDFRANLGSAP